MDINHCYFALAALNPIIHTASWSLEDKNTSKSRWIGLWRIENGNARNARSVKYAIKDQILQRTYIARNAIQWHISNVCSRECVFGASLKVSYIGSAMIVLDVLDATQKLCLKILAIKLLWILISLIITLSVTNVDS